MKYANTKIPLPTEVLQDFFDKNFLKDIRFKDEIKIDIGNDIETNELYDLVETKILKERLVTKKTTIKINDNYTPYNSMDLFSSVKPPETQEIIICITLR